MISIPGLDYEKCSVCGWVATEHQAKILKQDLLAEHRKQKPDKSIISKYQAEINQYKKHQNHD